MAKRTSRTTRKEPQSTELPPTSWAVLGMLSFGSRLSGYDLKKWADWSLQFFYWSPSYSQIYGELKRLEDRGYVTSEAVMPDDGLRGKRIYAITPSGTSAVARWVAEDPVDPPVLKHNPMLRVWLGHLAEPERLRKIVQEHRDYAEQMSAEAARDAEGARQDPTWAFPELVLRWSARHHEAERRLAEEMLEDIEELVARRAGESPS